MAAECGCTKRLKGISSRSPLSSSSTPLTSPKNQRLALEWGELSQSQRHSLIRWLFYSDGVWQDRRPRQELLGLLMLLKRCSKAAQLLNHSTVLLCLDASDLRATPLERAEDNAEEQSRRHTPLVFASSKESPADPACR